MEFYRVVVKVKPVPGFDAIELMEFYPVYSETAEAAANSVVAEKNVKKEDVLFVSYERMY